MLRYRAFNSANRSALDLEGGVIGFFGASFTGTGSLTVTGLAEREPLGSITAGTAGVGSTGVGLCSKVSLIGAGGGGAAVATTFSATVWRTVGRTAGAAVLGLNATVLEGVNEI